MTQIDDVLNVARSQIGYTESPRGSNMTKYGAEFDWNGVAWCSIFMWWIFKHADLEGLYPKTANTRVSYPWYKERGRIRASKNDGQPGDVIWFDFNPALQPVNHVGIIEKRLGAGHYTVIEGNTSPTSDANGGAVMRRDRSGSSIVAVGKPAYVLVPATDDLPFTSGQMEAFAYAGMKEALNDGTAFGTTSWAQTSKATLATVQGIVNKLNEVKADLGNDEDAILAALAVLRK